MLGVRNYQLGAVLKATISFPAARIQVNGSPCILFHACTYPELQWQRRQPRGPPEEPPSLTSSKCLASLRQQPYSHTHTRRRDGMQDTGPENFDVGVLLTTTHAEKNYALFAEAKEEEFDGGSYLERSVSEFLT